MPIASILGTSVHYLDPRGARVGAGTPTLVLLHGFGGSARQFEPLLAELGADVRPVSFDMPGCGRSGGVVLPDVPAMVECVTAVVDALAPEGPLAVLGHSFGGLVAAEVALALPARVRQLALVASAPRVRLHPEMQRQALCGKWDDVFLRGSFGPRAREDHIRLVLEDMRRLRLPRDQGLLDRWTRHDVRPRLGDVRAKTLVVVPNDDIILSPRNGDVWARGIPGAQKIAVADAGHYVQLEDAPAVARHLRTLLQGEEHETAKGESAP